MVYFSIFNGIFKIITDTSIFFVFSFLICECVYFFVFFLNARCVLGIVFARRKKNVPIVSTYDSTSGTMIVLVVLA